MSKYFNSKHIVFDKIDVFNETFYQCAYFFQKRIDFSLLYTSFQNKLYSIAVWLNIDQNTCITYFKIIY